MRPQSFAILAALITLACESPAPAATGTTADVATIADAVSDLAAPSDSAADVAAAVDSKVDSTSSDAVAIADAGLPDASADAAADAPKETVAAPDATADAAPEVAAEVSAADTGPVTDAVAPADAGCAPCAINCVCKKDKNGCPIPECETGDCLQLTSKLDAEIAKMQACTPDKGCQVFEYPYCGSAGCYQKPIAAGSDLTKIEPIADAAMKSQCSGFNCGCAPPKPAFCLDGSCKQCPPDCKGSCDEVKAALLGLAKQLGSYCGKDEDCTVLVTGLCPIGDLPCGGMPISKNADQTQIKALLEAYGPTCGAALCKCMPPKDAVCAKGKCVVPQ